MEIDPPASQPAQGDGRIGAQIGAWVVTGLLGRGGMATVYAARHAADGRSAALKLLHPGMHDAEALIRFRREFELLSRLRHPNLVQVYESGVYEEGSGQGQPWFSMELLQGEDLRGVVEAGRGVAVAAGVLRQVASALEYIHAEGLIHRDLTPGNLMLLPDGAVKLMDFGVVKDTGGDITSHGEFLGTAAYVAPEQILGQRIDRRTDLYSLGAVLYYLLTGQKPFQARTLQGLLDRQLRHPPVPPSARGPVPPLLEDVCLRLLQKDPSARFPDATHLLALLDDRGPMGPVPLAGRESEVQLLSERLRRLRGGRGGVVLLSGSAGAGKARLCRVMVDMARRAGVLALRTHATPSDLPLGAFGRLFDALAVAGLEAPRALAASFRGSGADRHATFQSYRELLAAGAAGGPMVLVLEDVQLLDASSYELLCYLLRNTVILAAQPVLWLIAGVPGEEAEEAEEAEEEIWDGSDRAEPTGGRGQVGAARGGWLADLDAQFRPTRLAVPPLSPEAVAELVGWLIGPHPAAGSLAKRIAAESGGNHSFVQEILRGLADEGVLVQERGRWRLSWSERQVQRCALPIPSSVREALTGRLRGLRPEARQMAEILAVAAQEQPVAVLAAVGGVSEGEVLATLEDLAEQGIVRQEAGGWGLAQARLRELLLGGVSGSDQAEIHRRIGEALERRVRHPLPDQLPVILDALAWHFEQGRQAGKGYAYLLRAGLSRLERSFMVDAEGLLSRALALEPEARRHLPLEEADQRLCGALLARAQALEHLGRHADSRVDLERARALAVDLQDMGLLARALGELGQWARQQGQPDEALALAQEALSAADRAEPRDPGLRSAPLQVLAGVAWARGDLDQARAHWSELATGEPSRDLQASAFGYNGLGLAALCRGQTPEARRNFEQSAAIFEQLGLAAPLALARGNLTEIHHFSGNLKRGLELAERAYAQALEAHHMPGAARILCYRALILSDLERGEAATEASEEGLRLTLQHGDPSDAWFARAVRIRTAWAARDRARVIAELDACDALPPGSDAETFLPLLLAWRARMLEAGEQARARALLAEAAEWSGKLWPYQECRLDLVLSRGYAQIGEVAEANRRAEAAIRRADACGFRLYALRGHWLALQGSDEAAASRHRRIAEGLARSLAASLSREDSERFLSRWLRPDAA